MKWKWLVSLVVTLAMLFPTVAIAVTTEPISPDVQPITAIDAESETEVTEDETKGKTESEIIEDMEEETKEDMESETIEDIEKETEEDTKSETIEDADKENEENTKSEGIEDADEDDPPEAPETESSLDSKKSNSEPFAVFALCAHEHSWSGDWSFDESYHWHECDAGDCPVTDNSEKDGYAKHSYDDSNICIACGYYALDSQIATIVDEADTVAPTYQQAYEAMIALKEKYPEGMTWTNYEPYGTNGTLGDSYVWKGGSIYGANSGVGCAAFAFILSDAAFGSLPARPIANGDFTFADVKVGDILRINSNSHSVIVLQKSAAGVIIAEANYNKTVHWGRAMTVDEVLAANYIITRYPEKYVPSDSLDADEVEYEGEVGTLSWSLTKAGVLTISGVGDIPDSSPNDGNVPEWNNHNNVSTIIIKEGVTGIGDYAFYQNSALTIYLPDGIAKIGQCAFRKSNLMSVTIPGTVQSIGNDAFRDCANLTSVSVSEGLKTIGERAFRACTSLTHIDFPATITSVGAGAFMDCGKMTRVRFMPCTETATLGDDLFSACRDLTSVTLPQTANCISTGMFASCNSLSELYIPASVTEIGNNAFNQCPLTHIYFGGTEAAWNEMMKPYLYIPDGVEIIFQVPFVDPFADSDDSANLPTDKDDGGNKTDSPPASSSNDSNDNSSSSSEPEKVSEPDEVSEPEEVSNLNQQYVSAQQNDIPLNSADEPDDSEVLSSSEESESAEPESQTTQDEDENEAVLEESSESDPEEVLETGDEEVKEETDSKSGKVSAKVIVPVVAVFVAAVPAVTFTFIRKKKGLKK